MLGRLVPHKRVELALRAVAALRERTPAWCLHVVGARLLADELVADADRLGIEDAVRFHGFVDDEAKNRLLASAWVNLLPSLKEGWGLAIVEAGALGTPSVAFREAGGTTESVVDGETGLLVDDMADWSRPPAAARRPRPAQGARRGGASSRRLLLGGHRHRRRGLLGGGRRPARTAASADPARRTAA